MSVAEPKYRMTTVRSAKNKAVRHQNAIRDAILATFPNLTADQVRCAVMGQKGEDIALSPEARALLPFSIEAKAHKTGFAKAYQALEQADLGDHAPIAVVKEDRREPLLIMRFNDFLRMLALDTEPSS